MTRKPRVGMEYGARFGVKGGTGPAGEQGYVPNFNG